MRTWTILLAALLLLVLGLAFVGLRALRANSADRTPEPGPAPQAPSTAELDRSPESARLANPARTGERAPAAPAPALAPPGQRPLRGRLVDDRTGEAVPDFALVVRRAEDETGEELVTDAEGRFRTRAPRAPGAFVLEWNDPSAEATSYEPTERTLDSLDLEHEFRLRIGPTYRLDLRAPAALAPADLRATLSSPAERELVTRRAFELAPVRDAPSRSLSVRDPPLPWVRFHPDQVLGAGSAGPWFLDVTSEDGLWSGGAEVRSIVGRYPEVVALDLASRAALRGSVRDEHGRPVVNAWVRIEREGGGDRHELWSLTHGEYRLRALAPGRWRLEIDSDDHVTHTATLDLQSGRESVHDATLVDLAPAGWVRGVVTSATGTWRDEGQAEVALWGDESTHSKSNRRSPVKWTQESGRWVHRFAFEDVPAGTYRLEWVSRTCPFDVLPGPVQLVTVPAEGVEIRIQDDAPTGQVVFRARDAANGKEIPTFDLWWAPLDGWAVWKRGVAAGEVVIERWPLNRELLWALRAPSGALVSGDARGFVREAGRLVADVSVDAGWGVQFFVADAGHRALPGIRFVFDGVAALVSGPRGRLPVSLPRRPGKIEVLTPGWRIARGNVDPATSDFDESNWWALEIVLESTKR